MSGFVLNSSDSGQVAVAKSFEHSDEPLGSLKGGAFLDWLSDCQFLKEDRAPWS
jgi:hypothetical protein